MFNSTFKLDFHLFSLIYPSRVLSKYTHIAIKINKTIKYNSHNQENTKIPTFNNLTIILPLTKASSTSEFTSNQSSNTSTHLIQPSLEAFN